MHLRSDNRADLDVANRTIPRFRDVELMSILVTCASPIRDRAICGWYYDESSAE